MVTRLHNKQKLNSEEIQKYNQIRKLVDFEFEEIWEKHLNTFTIKAPLKWLTADLIQVVGDELVNCGFKKEMLAGEGNSEKACSFSKDETQTFLCPTSFRDWQSRLVESIEVLSAELNITPVEWLLNSNVLSDFIELLETFESSVRDDDRSGSLPPEEIDEVNRQYVVAKQKLIEFASKYIASV